MNSQHRPPWWPQNEPWPPQSPSRQMRGRFLARAAFGMGCGLVMMFVLGAVVFGAIALAMGWWRGGEPMPPMEILRVLSPFRIVFVLLGMGFVGSLIFRMFRRITMPVADLIEAAGKLESGDYTARVETRGPREVRALARSFNQMANRLQTNEEQRRNLLADVSHELRTPLTVIQGNLEGMQDGVYPRDDARMQMLLDETRVMARLIDDLRTLSLAESGALKLQREELDLPALLGEVAASFAARADELGVALRVETAPVVPPVLADGVRIREVVANLVGNALRYTPRGGQITLAARADAIGQTASVSVSDTGAGIAPDALEHIFDRFYKSGDSGGSGLGLAIARQLVLAHGGQIFARSQPGVGATLTFELPIGQAG